MPRYIISTSWHGDAEVIETTSERAALKAARTLCKWQGLDDTDAWAEEYTEDRAWELGLLSEPQPMKG